MHGVKAIKAKRAASARTTMMALDVLHKAFLAQGWVFRMFRHDGVAALAEGYRRAIPHLERLEAAWRRI